MGLRALAGLIGLLTISSAISGSLDNWHWRNPLPQGSDLKSVAFGNGRFAAVGEVGTLLTSPDGTNWSLIAHPTTETLQAVSFINGHFMAVGDNGTVLVSTNGTTWQPRITGWGYTLFTMTYGKGLYVVGGTGTNLLTSPDGYTWTPRRPGVTSHFIRGLAFNGEVFVCAAGNYPFPGFLTTSTNGIDWSVAYVDSQGAFAGCAFGNGVFVAGSAKLQLPLASRCYISTNGLNWQPVNFNQPFVHNIAFVKDRFLIVRGSDDPYDRDENSSDVYESTNGFTWSYVEGLSAPFYVRAVSYGNDTWVGVGKKGLLTASDLTNSATFSAGTTRTFFNITYCNGEYLAVNFGVWSSSNAVDWVERYHALDGYPLRGITHGSGTYVSPRSDGRILISSGGESWVEIDPHAGFALNCVAYGAGVFVIGGDAGILSSSDGLIWTEWSTGGARISDIEYINGMFVAVGNSGVFTSMDGLTWIRRDSGDLEGLTSVAHGDGLFVAVGGLLYGKSVVATSSDGFQWTRQYGVTNHLPPVHEVACASGVFMAISSSGGECWSSTDGQTWSRHNKRFKSQQSICSDGSTFLLTGGNGAIVQTDPIIRLQRKSFSPTHSEWSLSGPTGTICRVETSSTLNDPLSWQVLTNVTMTSNRMSWFETPATNSIRFYRGRLLP
jgi:hypothetical protein